MAGLRSVPFGRVWLTLLGIAISITALWIAVRNVDLVSVGQRLGQADLRYLLAALAVGAIQFWLRLSRWQLLLPRRGDGTRIRRARLLPVLLIGYLGNVALPARLGELVRAYLVARREGLDSVAVLGTVVLERILDVVALAGFALVIAMAIGAPSWVVGGAALAAVVGAVSLAVAVAGLPAVVGALHGRAEPAKNEPWWLRVPGSRVLLRLTARFSAGVGGSHSPGTVTMAALLSFLAWPLDAILMWLIAASIGVDISPAAAALISAAAVLSTAVPSAPGYVGTYELAAAVAAQAMGVAATPAFALAVLAHAFTILPAAIGGAICLIGLRGSIGTVLPPREPATSRPGS
jgi:uncharacterized membrane protein YbhN (UPF0104 family)